ncbi:MAG: HAD-IC family P-type ATPase [Bdellovibrionota bacterium]
MFFAWTDLPRAIKTAVTISLVTCPCGIGIGIPMAQMVAQRKLLSMGIYLRDLNLLEHIQKIKTLVFDKTGTLTLAELRIKNPQEIDTLSTQDQSVLFHAAAQSQHPVSQSIYQNMITKSLPLANLQVQETAGHGLEIKFESDRYFMGRSDVNATFVFEKNGEKLIHLEFEETLLEDARPVFEYLKLQNYRLHVLSGDKIEKVASIANKLGIQESEYTAQCTPQQKEQWLQTNHPETSLFLGDGLNDSLALESALISGASLSNSLTLLHMRIFIFQP